MKRPTLAIIIIIAAIGGGTAWQVSRPEALPVEAPETAVPAVASDPADATYRINGEDVVLIDGYAESAAGSGTSKTVTRVWSGEPQFGDLDADGANDAALIITQDNGGSGTFFYIAAALKNRATGGYDGTEAYLLGDRIAPQNFSIYRGAIEVNFAERAPGEPMTARPSVGVTTYLRVEAGALVGSNSN